LLEALFARIFLNLRYRCAEIYFFFINDSIHFEPLFLHPNDKYLDTMPTFPLRIDSATSCTCWQKLVLVRWRRGLLGAFGSTHVKEVWDFCGCPLHDFPVCLSFFLSCFFRVGESLHVNKGLVATGYRVDWMCPQVELLLLKGRVKTPVGFVESPGAAEDKDRLASQLVAKVVYNPRTTPPHTIRTSCKFALGQLFRIPKTLATHSQVKAKNGTDTTEVQKRKETGRGSDLWSSHRPRYGLVLTR